MHFPKVLQWGRVWRHLPTAMSSRQLLVLFYTLNCMLCKIWQICRTWHLCQMRCKVCSYKSLDAVQILFLFSCGARCSHFFSNCGSRFGRIRKGSNASERRKASVSFLMQFEFQWRYFSCPLPAFTFLTVILVSLHHDGHIFLGQFLFLIPAI